MNNDVEVDFASNCFIPIVRQETEDNEQSCTATTLPPGFTYPCYKNTLSCAPHYTKNHKRTNVLCANCGCMGHIYKNCNHPIISYGVICYKLVYDEALNGIYPKFLMVQRKDSLHYVEFIRGKYNVKAKTYIMDMFTLMTNDERQAIATHTFETLWQTLWCKSISDDSKSFSKEYKDAYEKFNMLKKGYFIRNKNDLSFFNIDYILTSTQSKYNETEWGFPKGRRNINEGDISCAFREFREETGLSSNSIKLCPYIKPLEEVFSGSNKVRYKHVYYIAKMNDDIEVVINPLNKQQCKEIRNIQWFNYNDAQNKIRDTNVERKELFRRLNQIIIKSIR